MFDDDCPWLAADWANLIRVANSARMPHAMLWVAPVGLGLISMARAFMQYLICQQPVDDQACGECTACQLYQAGTHPDFHHLTIEEKSRDIKIDQVRRLIEQLNERPHQNGRRLVLLEPAEAMNKATANAFLKTLEEPGEDTFLLLLTSRQEAMMPTIRSRCQVHYFNAPGELQAIDYVLEHHPDQLAIARTAVRLAQNRPLLALELIERGALQERQDFFAYLESMLQKRLDPLEYAAKNKSGEAVVSCCDWLYELMLDAEKVTGGVETKELLSSDQPEMLDRLIKTSPEARYQWQQRLAELKRTMITATNVNPQLTMEALLTGWIAFLAD